MAHPGNIFDDIMHPLTVIRDNRGAIFKNIVDCNSRNAAFDQKYNFGISEFCINDNHTVTISKPRMFIIGKISRTDVMGYEGNIIPAGFAAVFDCGKDCREIFMLNTDWV